MEIKISKFQTGEKISSVEFDSLCQLLKAVKSRQNGYIHHSDIMNAIYKLEQK